MRVITYTIAADGISPVNTQIGGVQGEHNATLLEIYAENVANIIGDTEGKICCRIEGVDGAGSFYSSDSLDMDSPITFKIPYELTAAGGTAQLRLNLCELLDNKEERIVISYPMRIMFAANSTGGESEENYKYQISGALAAARKAAKEALELKEAVELKLENGEYKGEPGVSGVYVGSGNMPEGYNVQVDPDSDALEVKNFIDEHDVKNPVSGAAVFNYVNVEPFLKRKYLLIGDSYGLGALAQKTEDDGTEITGWAPLFKKKMGLDDEDCVINTLGGSGFCNAKTIDETEYKFIDLLTTKIVTDKVNNTITVTEDILVQNKEGITDIIVCGGYNDRPYSTTEIVNAIDSFVAKAKKLYPNALVSIGMIGASSDTEDTNTNYNEQIRGVLEGYVGITKVADKPYRFLNNLEYVLKLSPIYISDDKVHPTQAGYEALSNAICKAVLGGFNTGVWAYSPEILPADDNITVFSTNGARVKISNGMTQVQIGSTIFEFTNSIEVKGNTDVAMCKFSNSLISGTDNTKQGVITQGVLVSPDDTTIYKIVPMKVFIKRGILFVRPYFLNDANTGYGTMTVKKIQLFQVDITTDTIQY